MKKKLYYYFLLLILLSSCEEKINLKVPDSYTRIVVEGEITTEKKSHLIKLSVTSSYFVNQPTKYLSGANVSISDGNVTWQLKEKEAGHYYTESDVQGEVGKTYFLRIENVDVDGDGEQEVYTASELLKPCANPDSIACSKIKYMS